MEQQNKLMAVLAYIGPLVIVSYLVANKNPFVKFHIKQGLVLFAISIICWFLRMAVYSYAFWSILNIVNLAILVLAIIGIVNVVNGKEKELPVVGQFSKHFPI